MLVKNLFEKQVYEETMQRINALQPDSVRQWGKMTVAQMMAHCQGPFYAPIKETAIRRPLFGLLLGWAFKKSMYNEKPFKQGMPTAPALRVTDERNFETEKEKLKDLVTRFYTMGPGVAGKFPHPIFGSYTPEQWGKMEWKHLDHHLRQFNV